MKNTISSLLISIKNAKEVKKPEIVVNFSKFNESILKIFKSEGFIEEFIITNKQNKKYITVINKNTKNIYHLKQISKPGRKIYAKSKDMPRPLRGLGLVIVSTPKGVITAKEARKIGVGGELICELW